MSGVGHFYEFDTFAADSFGVSCLEFDLEHDLLLVGSGDGRLSSFYPTSMDKNEDGTLAQQARWGKYSSVRIAQEAVVDILPSPRHILSLSKSLIAATTIGGLRQGSIMIPKQETISEHGFR
jgi:hypothetical protein